MTKRESKGRPVVSQNPRMAMSTQLELVLPAARSAAILSFTKSTASKSETKSSAVEHQDASKRILDFAATLPDW